MAKPTYVAGTVKDEEVRQELERVADAIGPTDLLSVTVSNVAPARPQDGDIRYADGTNWDPGSGRGIYYYNANTPAWVKLG